MASCARTRTQREQGHLEGGGQARKRAGRKPAEGILALPGLTALRWRPGLGRSSSFSGTQCCSSLTPRSRPVPHRPAPLGGWGGSPLGLHCRWSSASR